MGTIGSMDNNNQEFYTIRSKDGCTDEIKDLFARKLLVSKQDILTQLDLMRADWEKESQTEKKHSKAFYSILFPLIDRFRGEVKFRPLFNELEPFWCYSIRVKSTGAYLMLNHYSFMMITKDEEIRSVFMDGSYELIHAPTRHLLIDEYASIYGVEPNTVRMWIRRGKIRTAIKSGREWQIPELTDTPERGYTTGQYDWREPLMDLPEEFSYLLYHNSVSISQNTDDKSLFDVSFMENSDDDHSITLTQSERERLEMFLISHPLVEYLNDGYAHVSEKGEVKVEGAIDSANEE